LAAQKAESIICKILTEKRTLRFLIATGVSQFEFLENLVKMREIDWDQSEMFHLDEYIGLSEDHPASFRNYLKNKFIKYTHPKIVNLIQGDAQNIEKEISRLNKLISKAPIDIAFIGIGENGHIAFNDPPADFEIQDPYIKAKLDKECRLQQVGEGWFKTLDEVPTYAITCSISQVMKAKHIICICPDERKALAVKNCFEDRVKPDPMYPASILNIHPDVYCYLDKNSGKFLNIN